MASRWHSDEDELMTPDDLFETVKQRAPAILRKLDLEIDGQRPENARKNWRRSG